MSFSRRQPAAADAATRVRGTSALRPLLVGAGVIFALSGRAESNLLDNSPFLPADAARAVPQAAPLELRSILKAAGRYEFSLYDPVKKQSTWAGLNELGNSFVVKSFDANREVVVIEQHGRLYSLILREASITPLVVTPDAVASGSGLVTRSAADSRARQIKPLTPQQQDLLRRREIAIGRLAEFRRQAEDSLPAGPPDSHDRR